VQIRNLRWNVRKLTYTCTVFFINTFYSLKIVVYLQSALYELRFLTNRSGGWTEASHVNCGKETSIYCVCSWTCIRVLGPIKSSVASEQELLTENNINIVPVNYINAFLQLFGYNLSLILYINGTLQGHLLEQITGRVCVLGQASFVLPPTKYLKKTIG
jgi:hypothetical protein